MGQALYRKYRPKKLSEIVGEEHITSTLTNALANDQISHAYLFTGPRGVGKTSVARILAHEINKFDYSDGQEYLDIIEIDAASNRRIDEIRQLRDRVNIAPTSGKYKVYIIDEVHMLTREAFNALLKTLEEPPAHAIFILATTEAYKVPDTIVSRTQQFNFRPISVGQLIGQLKDIAKKENIVIDDKALDIIADYGQGSFRDSISLLDQASSISNKVTDEDIISLLGMAPSKIIENIIKALEYGSINDLTDVLKLVDENGYNITVLCKQLLTKLKSELTEGQTNLESINILNLMKSIVDVPSSSDSSTSLEIILMEAVLKRKIIAPVNVLEPPNISEPTVLEEELQIIDEIKPITEVVEVQTLPEPKEKVIKNVKTKKRIPGNKEFNEELWQDLLDAIKIKYNTLYGIMRMAIPTFKSNRLVLTTKFDFHKRLLNDTKNQAIMIELIKELTGNIIEIQAVHDKNIEIENREERTKDLIENNESITTINNIFGSSEVVE